MALTAHRLTKQYVTPEGQALTVLDVPHFAVADGEQLALVGGSGTGKTTLLHCLAGIVVPTSGRVVFHTDAEAEEVAASLAAGTGRGRFHPGTNLADLSESGRDAFRGRHIGYVFQTHHLLPGFTALENVLLGMSFTGRRPDRAWAVHLLEAVGLKERLNYRPGKLSLGQQQRVAVARALANRPSVVLADEPTGSLDPATAQGTLDLIRTLCAGAGAALVMVTHDRALAGQLPRVVDLASINEAVGGR